MNRIDCHVRRRRWRVLFAAVMLFTAFSGAGLPYSEHQAWAADRTVEVAAPLTGGNADVTAQSVTGDESATPVPAPYTPSVGHFRYFSETGHFLRGVFLTFWQTHGQTPVFGLPITEPIVEDGLTVQYLERARLEWHPENPVNQQVQLTRLGSILSDQSGPSFTSLSDGTDSLVSHFFPETGHNLSHAFLTYWQNNGGLAVFGYPISEEMPEVSPTDGQTYTVQYFERNRFEWHPEQTPSYNVQLGLLGSEYAQQENLNSLARILLPFPITKDADLTNSPQLSNYVDPGLLSAIQELGNTPQFKWIPALIVQNKVTVTFEDIGEPGVAGAFAATYSKTRPYVIVIPTSERNASTEVLASVLAHEATHAADTIEGVVTPRSDCSVEEELRAYRNGLAAWLLLEGSDALSQSYPRGSLDADINESFVEFNNNDPNLTLNFDLETSRSFIADLYGSSCGA